VLLPAQVAQAPKAQAAARVRDALRTSSTQVAARLSDVPCRPAATPRQGCSRGFLQHFCCGHPAAGAVVRGAAGTSRRSAGTGPWLVLCRPGRHSQRSRQRSKGRNELNPFAPFTFWTSSSPLFVDRGVHVV